MSFHHRDTLSAAKIGIFPESAKCFSRKCELTQVYIESQFEIRSLFSLNNLDWYSIIAFSSSGLSIWKEHKSMSFLFSVLHDINAKQRISIIEILLIICKL